MKLNSLAHLKKKNGGQVSKITWNLAWQLVVMTLTTLMTTTLMLIAAAMMVMVEMAQRCLWIHLL